MTTRRPPSGMMLYALASQVGVEMVAPLVIGLVFDSYQGTSPVGAVCGAVLGFVGGMVHLFVVASKSGGRRGPDAKG